MPLFSTRDLNDVLRNHETRIASEVDKLTRDQVIALSEEQLVEHVTAKLLIEPITLLEDRQELEMVEMNIDVSWDRRRAVFDRSRPAYVPGHKAKVTIPFTGESALFGFCPSSYRTSFPEGEFNGDTRLLVISHAQTTDEPKERFKESLDKTISSIRFYLENQKVQIQEFNAQLPDKVRMLVKARKERLGDQTDIQKLLGIPLKRRDGAVRMEAINLPRQLVRPLPAVPAGGFPAEPGITREDYEHILGVVRHAGRTFERTPKTYSIHDEEELRDIVLANLNSHYQGAAGGETFRGRGKTDICIEEKSRAAFVAECKVWRGASEFSQAIDQLLSYLTWRDCKTALVIFNKKNAKFSELLNKLPSLVQTHASYRRSTKTSENGEWRFTMVDPKDDGREIYVTVFAFNLHC